jgi:hypothetical protein
MKTLSQAIDIWRQFYGVAAPAEPSKIFEAPTFWWFPPESPCIGHSGVFVDKVDQHLLSAGSCLTFDEYVLAYRLGFRHENYELTITGDSLYRATGVLRSMEYRIPITIEDDIDFPIAVNFRWIEFRHLPKLLAAKDLTYEVTVTNCQHEDCSWIGRAITPFEEGEVAAALAQYSGLRDKRIAENLAAAASIQPLPYDPTLEQ